MHDLNVPRDHVYAVMYNVDPDALAERAPQYKKKKAKGNFISRGPKWVHSLDGHDKLMGYKNSTFPIAVYGCIVTCTCKSNVIAMATFSSVDKKKCSDKS